MSRALDIAIERMGSSELVNGDSDGVVRAALTRAIVEAAEKGGRNEQQLAEYALANYERSKAGIAERDIASQP